MEPLHTSWRVEEAFWCSCVMLAICSLVAANVSRSTDISAELVAASVLTSCSCRGENGTDERCQWSWVMRRGPRGML